VFSANLVNNSILLVSLLLNHHERKSVQM